ncbi:MAG: PD-(D/E)XK nuclease family protein [Sedimentisphaerales bacterium]
MAVQFILGRSGTGKTSYCIKSIVNALLELPCNQPLLFLVPEQATYQAERAILADKRIVGYSRLNVLSFDRLQFLLLGKNTARPALSRIGQQMIIHRILRDNISKLKIFNLSANWPGLGRQMAQTIIELHQYAKTPEDIDQLLGELGKDERNNLATLKFADIGLIFKEYLSFIEGKFLDPDIQLNQACRAVASANWARGAKLWIDGFASFTASELAILAELLKVAADVQISLCLDPSDIDLTNPDAQKVDPVGLFNPTQHTYTALIELIKKCKLPLAEPIILEQAVRFSASGQLAHVERNIFESQASKMASADNIHIVSAPNARAEVQFVAKQVLQLVKEKDYRYRDIAVIASNIDCYEHYIRAYFDDYDIPFFIDKPKPLNQHAAIQLICSALQAVTGGFSNSDIFAYLKTDLVPIERRDVDMLENYCLAFGITGSDWTSGRDWCFAGQDNEKFDEQRINQIRLRAIGPLLELADRLRASDGPAMTVSPEQLTQIIFDFLDSLQVRQTLGAWIEEATKQKDYSAVDEHRQFYDKFLNIFDELCEVFAGQKMSLADYLAILHSAFSQLTLAFIPPSLDQVLVGSIERSRHPDLKAVFLIGATQKQFPVPVSFDSILTEDDRNAAESADFPLAATASQKLAERQYLAYIAFTRPSQFLCVTYPAVDDKADAVPRSQFVDDLELLFENLSEESIAGEQTDIDSVLNEMQLQELLCSYLGKDVSRYSPEVSRQQLSELLGGICSDEQLTGLGSNVVSAINYNNSAKLDSDVLEDIFGPRITSSATRLSTFAACPYQYFARYVLELKEREEFKLEPLDVGVFYHRVLDGLLKRLNAAGYDFVTAKDEQLLEFLREQISKLVTEDSFLSNFARHSAHNRFIIHSASEYLEDCVLAIAEMVRAGSFRPKQSEVLFGQGEDERPQVKRGAKYLVPPLRRDLDRLGEYQLTLPSGRLLSLNGKIDRLDVADVDGKEVVIIFDYKRKEQYFDWSKFYYGLDMQLPIYMLAVRSAGSPQSGVPANSKTKNIVGAFYMPVEVRPETTTFAEFSQKTDSFNHKAKGLFNGGFAQQIDKKASQDSKFYNFYVTKDGQPYGHYEDRGALKPADFERVLKFTERKIIELAGKILSGIIHVRPYRLSGKSPCSFCKYKPVCRFDWQINDYNFLESLNKLQVLEKITGADG